MPASGRPGSPTSPSCAPSRAPSAPPCGRRTASRRRRSPSRGATSRSPQPQAVLINAGVRECGDRRPGRGRRRRHGRGARARRSGSTREEIVVLSTGVIGAPLPLDKVLAGARAAVAELSPDGGDAAAAAILTTDSGPKVASRGGRLHRRRMAKGAGMIHPRLATMLVVITTDYPLAPGEADAFLRPAVERQLQPDLGRRRLLDERRGRPARERRERRAPATTRRSPTALDDGLLRSRPPDRRRRRGCDGRARDRGDGAASAGEAEAIARRIATSPLVKTAAFGHDPNWGRVLWRRDRRRRRRLRAARRRIGSPSRSTASPSSTQARRPAPLPELARRASAGSISSSGSATGRRLPRVRPHVRLRADQRGVHDVSRVVLKLGGRVAADAARARRSPCARPATRSSSSTGPAADHGRDGAARDRADFVDGRRVTTPEVLEVVRELARRGERRGLRRDRRRRASRSSATRSGCRPLRSRRSGSSATRRPPRRPPIEEALAAGRIPWSLRLPPGRRRRR